MIRPSFLLAALSLGAVVASAQPLKPGVRITIPDAPGKFDFLEVDTGRHRLLAAHEKSDTADFIDLNTNQLLARVKLGTVVDTIVDPKTGNYYSSVQEDKRVAVLDGQSLKEIGSFAVEGETDGIIFEPKSRHLFVTHDNGTHLWVVDVDASKIVATIDIPAGPECLTLDGAANRLYLNCKTTSEVIVVDTVANKVVAKWSTAPATAPHGIALDAAAGRLYSAGDNGVLAVLDTKSGKVIGTAKITEHVDQAAIDLANHAVYCAGPNWLSVVRTTATGADFVGNVATAETAKNVAVDPATHAVWTTYTDGKHSYAQSFVRP
jgi:DNA-binding beta-propeller fold protein YncE